MCTVCLLSIKIVRHCAYLIEIIDGCLIGRWTFLIHTHHMRRCFSMENFRQHAQNFEDIKLFSIHGRKEMSRWEIAYTTLRLCCVIESAAGWGTNIFRLKLVIAFNELAWKVKSAAEDFSRPAGCSLLCCCFQRKSALEGEEKFWRANSAKYFHSLRNENGKTWQKQEHARSQPHQSKWSSMNSEIFKTFAIPSRVRLSLCEFAVICCSIERTTSPVSLSVALGDYIKASPVNFSPFTRASTAAAKPREISHFHCQLQSDCSRGRHTQRSEGLFVLRWFKENSICVMRSSSFVQSTVENRINLTSKGTVDDALTLSFASCCMLPSEKSKNP